MYEDVGQLLPFLLMFSEVNYLFDVHTQSHSDTGISNQANSEFFQFYMQEEVNRS